MEIAPLTQIDLTNEEQNLWKQFCGISFDKPEHEVAKTKHEAAYLLFKKLDERRAIPPIRWEYFVNPKLNIHGRGKSHKGIFERNGTHGDAIYKHGNFHKYLRYFVLGPDLPSVAKDELEALARDCQPITSGDVNEFCDLARQQVRRFNLENKTVAEEYFRLGLELELGRSMARAIRDSVWRLKNGD